MLNFISILQFKNWKKLRILIFPTFMHLKYWDKILGNLVQPCYKLMPSFFNPNWFQLLLSSSWIYCLIIPIVRTSQNSVFHFYYALESKSLLWQQAFSSLFIITEKARKRLVPLTGWFGQAYRRKGKGRLQLLLWLPKVIKITISLISQIYDHFIIKTRMVMLKMPRF